MSSALVRAAGIKSLSPPRQFEQPWRPRTPYHFPDLLLIESCPAKPDLAHKFRRDGRTLPGLVTRDAASRFAYYASTQALAATKIAAISRLSSQPRFINLAPASLALVGMIIGKKAESTKDANSAKNCLVVRLTGSSHSAALARGMHLPINKKENLWRDIACRRMFASG